MTNFYNSDKIVSQKRKGGAANEKHCEHGQGPCGHRAVCPGRQDRGPCDHLRQLPIDPATGAFPEGIQAQTRQSLTNVKAILEEAGLTMDSVIKTTVFLSDMNNFGAMNEVYATFFTEGSFPARSAVEVARLPKDALVEIEVIAAL